MKKNILITAIVLLFSLNTSYASEKVIYKDKDYLLEINDNYELVLLSNGKTKMLGSYGYDNTWEAIMYDDFVIYNGSNWGGIGLYLYSIKNEESYLLNDPLRW